MPYIAKIPPLRRDFWLPGNDLLSQGVAPQLPSALRSLTSVFGMGTGVSFSPLSPDIIYYTNFLSLFNYLFIFFIGVSCKIKCNKKYVKAIDKPCKISGVTTTIKRRVYLWLLSSLNTKKRTFKHLTAFDRGKIAALRAAGNALQMPMKLAAIKARLAVN